MREYRGKRIDGEGWKKGDLVRDCYDRHFIVMNYLICDSGRNSFEWHEVDPSTVGQNTGLKDKNGKEIYEGDIVKQTYHLERGSYDDVYSLDGHHIGEVVFTTRGVHLKNPLHYSMDNDVTERTKMRKPVAGYRSEVLGSIHDNPELLEAE